MIALICASLLLEQREVGAEDLHVERALEAGQRFVDGVLGGLGVVERDAGKDGELLLDRVDQLRPSSDTRRSTRRTASARRRTRR